MPFYDIKRQIPVDLLATSLGEPKHPYQTKYGGMPFRPHDKPWPIGRNRNPCFFLMQFNFTHSKDHIGNLPGDILLLFLEQEESMLGGYGFIKSEVICEWYSIRDVAFQVVPAIPNTTHNASFHCTMTRNFEFIYNAGSENEINKSSGCLVDTARTSKHERAAYWHTNKIGGIPCVQNNEESYRHIASFTGVSPFPFKEKQFTNYVRELTPKMCLLPEFNYMSYCNHVWEIFINNNMNTAVIYYPDSLIHDMSN